MKNLKSRFKEYAQNRELHFSRRLAFLYSAILSLATSGFVVLSLWAGLVSPLTKNLHGNLNEGWSAVHVIESIYESTGVPVLTVKNAGANTGAKGDSECYKNSVEFGEPIHANCLKHLLEITFENDQEFAYKEKYGSIIDDVGVQITPNSSLQKISYLKNYIDPVPSPSCDSKVHISRPLLGVNDDASKIFDREISDSSLSRAVLCFSENNGSFAARSYFETCSKEGESYSCRTIPEPGMEWSIMSASSRGLFLSKVTKPAAVAKSFVSQYENLSDSKLLKLESMKSASFKDSAMAEKYVTSIIESLFRFNNTRCSQKDCIWYDRAKDMRTDRSLFWSGLVLGANNTGYIQILILLLTTFGLFYLLFHAHNMDRKFRYTARFNQLYLSNNPKKRDAAISVLKSHREREYESGISTLIARSIFAKKSDSIIILEGECDTLLTKEISTVWFIRYLVWLVPIVGFIGTVIGISMAIPLLGQLLSNDEAIKSTTMDRMGRDLSVAFGTTLVGLIGSVVLQLRRSNYEENYIPDSVIGIRNLIAEVVDQSSHRIGNETDVEGNDIRVNSINGDESPAEEVSVPADITVNTIGAYSDLQPPKQPPKSGSLKDILLWFATMLVCFLLIGIFLAA